jgi:hypothetical protein
MQKNTRYAISFIRHLRIRRLEGGAIPLISNLGHPVCRNETEENFFFFFRKLHPVQQVGNLLPFRPPLYRKWSSFYCTLTINCQGYQKWRGYSARLWGYSVNPSWAAESKLFSNYKLLSTYGPKLTHNDITFRISGTLSSHPFAQWYWRVLQATETTWCVFITVFMKVSKEVLDPRCSTMFFLVIYSALPSFPIFSPR